MKKDAKKSPNAAERRRLAKERRKSKPPSPKGFGVPGKSARAAEAEAALRESESRYRQLVDNTDTGFVVVDDTGVVLEANEPYMRLIGATKKEDAIGHSVIEWTAPEEQMNNAAAVARCAEQGYIQNFETIYRRKDGKTINILINATVQESPRGKRLVALCRDITERKRAEEALRESRFHLNEAQRLAKMGSWSWIVETDFVTWSDELCAINRRDPKLPAIRYAEQPQLYTPESWARLDNAVRRTLATGEPYELELEIIREDGTHYWGFARGAAIWDDTGRMIQLHGTVQDITERKRVENEREQLNQELARANQELETLIRIASHDLRSPLINIQGFNQLLNKACDAIFHTLTNTVLPDETRQALVAYHEKAAKAIRFINAGVEKMNGLVSGLLRLLQLGRAPLALQPLDMNALLQTVVEAMAFQIRTAAAEVTVDALPDCRADMALINQIFSNLLDNAIKYRDSVRPLRVRVWGRYPDWGGLEKGARAVYCVEDNGLGVAPEHQQKIWDLFYRTNPQGSVVGEGIGLPSVQRIVERHGGTVWMESEIGKGSRFFMALPAAAKETEP